MRKREYLSIACLLCLAAPVAHSQVDTSLSGANPSPESAFIRVDRDDAGTALSFQTSIVSFRAPDGAGPAGLEVDLVGAIHIADSRYYEELNARFLDYDAVLYELVAPEGTRVPLGGVEDNSLLSSLQGGMAHMLGLEFQLRHVDYTRANLIHSDLSPEQMADSMAARGETAADYLSRAIAMMMNDYARDPLGVRNLGLILALFSADRERLLKVQVAGLMLATEAATAVFEGPDGSTLIGERNKRAFSVLQDRIRLGDRRIAIFFGAAHMNGIAELLTGELGLQAAGTVWIDAWDLR
jgi:hypothetical protein